MPLVRDEYPHRLGQLDDRPLVIPPQAVVVPGSRALPGGWGKQWNLSLYTPVIVKYRDSKTDRSIRLEDLLR